MREPDVTAATRRLLGLPADPGFTHLDAEGRARMAAGAFFGSIGYVSALARRP